MWELSCIDLLQPWGQETTPHRAPPSTWTSAIQWESGDTMWPYPPSALNLAEGRLATSLCNVVLYRSHGETITVTGSWSYVTSQSWHTWAGLCPFGAHTPCHSPTPPKVLGSCPGAMSFREQNSYPSFLLHVLPAVWVDGRNGPVLLVDLQMVLHEQDLVHMQLVGGLV